MGVLTVFEKLEKLEELRRLKKLKRRFRAEIDAARHRNRTDPSRWLVSDPENILPKRWSDAPIISEECVKFICGSFPLEILEAGEIAPYLQVDLDESSSKSIRHRVEQRLVSTFAEAIEESHALQEILLPSNASRIKQNDKIVRQASALRKSLGGGPRPLYIKVQESRDALDCIIRGAQRESRLLADKPAGNRPPKAFIRDVLIVRLATIYARAACIFWADDSPDVPADDDLDLQETTAFVSGVLKHLNQELSDEWLASLLEGISISDDRKLTMVLSNNLKARYPDRHASIDLILAAN
jgi:hypothetical protein